MTKGKQRFKAPNYSRGCVLAKAFGVLAANSGEKFTRPGRRGDRGGPVAVSTREGKLTKKLTSDRPIH